MRQRLYRRPARVKSHTKDADCYFGTLGFTLPVEELTLRSTSLTNVLSSLTQPHGPSLVDGTSTENKLMALAILVSPEAFKDPDSPLVDLGFLYKASYIRTVSWSKAYFELKLASQAEAGSHPLETKVIFVQILMNSQVIPLPSVPTLFLDVKAPEDITDSKASRPTRGLRGFQLFRVVHTGEDPPVAHGGHSSPPGPGHHLLDRHAGPGAASRLGRRVSGLGGPGSSGSSPLEHPE